MKGLYLFPNETKLFPKRLVSPSKGIGWGVTGPKHIITYQLNVDVCPHISKDNLCRIYDRRPLACQAFPLISVGAQGTTIADPNDCTFVEETEKEKGSLNNILPMTPKKFKGPEEWMAIGKIEEQVRKSTRMHRGDSRVIWDFNLNSQEWEILMAL